MKAPVVVVSGRVVGPSGEGIPGASVMLCADSDGRALEEGTLSDLLSGRLVGPNVTFAHWTKEDGTFRFEIPPTGRARVIADRVGWTPARLERVSFLADSEDILLRLLPPSPVAGTVLRLEAGEWVPLAGAEAILFEERRTDPVLTLGILGSAESDVEGRFSIPGSQPGRAGLAVVARGWKPVVRRQVEVPSEGNEFRLDAGSLRYLRGIVFLPDGTTPAPGVRITVATRPRGWPADALQEQDSDREGRFAFEEVEGGDDASLTVRFQSPSGAIARIDRNPWPGNSDERVTLEQPPTGKLRVRVVENAPDGSRRPMPGLRLAAGSTWSSRWGKESWKAERETGPDGAVRFDHVPEGEVGVRPAGPDSPWLVDSPRFGLAPPKPAEGAWEMELVLVPNPRAPREVSVAGIVVGLDGAPVPGARVEGFGAPGFTNREGRFLLRGKVLPDGLRTSLQATAEGFQPARSGAIQILPGADQTGVQITFTGVLLPVRGRVVDEEGKPLAGVRVHLPLMGLTWTGPDGWWRLEGIPGKVSKALFSLRGFQPMTLDEVQAGDPVETVVLVRE